MALSFKDEKRGFEKIVWRGVCPKGNVAFLGVWHRHYMTEECSYRSVGFVRIWTKIGRFFGPKANLKHLKHPKHLKHLKHLMWMFELLFCKHFKELGGKVNDGVHGRQYQ